MHQFSKSTFALSFQFLVFGVTLFCSIPNLWAAPITSWDFETVTKDKSGKLVPEGWMTSTPNTASVVSDEVHSGNHALRLAVPTLQTSPNQPAWQTGFIPAHGRIKMSGWMKTSQVLIGKSGWHQARIVFFLYDENYKPVAKLSHGHADVAVVSDTTPWTQYQWTGKLPDEVAYIRIICTISHTTGIAWFDDIQVQSLPETDIEKQQRLEGERLKLADKSTSEVQAPAKKVNIMIDPVPVSDRSGIQRPNFFATIRNDGFYQNGRRAFLLGGEANATLYPYLYRLLGLDFISLNDTYNSASVGEFKNTGDNWHASYHPYDYLPVEVNTLLSNRLMPYIAFQEVSSKYMPLFKADPRLFAERGHFLNYSPLNPIGENLRWNERQALINSTKDQPVWAWELFNEVYYRDHDEANLKIFRQWAKTHYGNIAKANAAWKTDYSDFSQVSPPNPGYRQQALRITMPRGASDQLYTDFMKSQEEVFGNYLIQSQEKMKKLDPLGYVTVQAPSNLRQDYVDSGVRPELAASGQDFYGAENPQVLYFQGKQNDPDEITDMLLTPMVYDITRAAAGGRPIVDEENTLSGRGGPKQEIRPLLDLAGTWRFHPEQDTNTDGQWTQSGFDDSSWKTIQVPGLWGTQGFADTQIGWYRQTFRLPPEPKLMPEEKVLLQGKGLTDKATIYVNGQKIHETSTWKEVFSLDISHAVQWNAENHIAIRIENHYLSNGYYWGGIRDYLKLVVGVPQGPQPMGAGQMRSWLWTKAIHGCAGSVLSYLYSNEATPKQYSPFSPYKIQPQALKTIAATHQKINDLASMMLTVPGRKEDRVGLIYPITSFRARIPKDYTDFLQGPLTRQLAGYYSSLLFNHIPFDMVTESALQDADRYRALILAVAPRVSTKEVQQLETYVRHGGTLFVSADSLIINDDTNSPLENISWLPNRRQTSADQVGKALGKGHVYMLPANASLSDLQPVIKTLLARAKIQPDMQVTQKGNEPASYVEAHTFKEEHRAVWYLMNWGASCDVVVSAPSLPQGKVFRVRDAVSDKIISSPTGSATWTPQQLSKGISLTVPCQDPRILLIEDSEAKPMLLTTLAPELQQQIDKAWHPTIASERKVLFDAALYERMTPVMIPTAVEEMEKVGYGVYTSLKPIVADKPFATWDGKQIDSHLLKDFKVLVYACPQGNLNVPAGQIEAIKQFVASGGGLLLLANPPHGPHGWLSPNIINKLAEPFGITVGSSMLKDKNHCQDNQPLLPIFTDITDHPVTVNVHTFNPAGSASLQIKSDSAKVLIRGSASASVPNAPVLAVASYGKGRVAVAGGGYWLEPDAFVKGDNQELLRNLLHWLEQGA